MVLSIDRYVDIVTAESARFADVVAAGPLDAAVPGCPGWDLTDLAKHMGGVQRWATGILRTGEPGPFPDQVEEPIDAWFRAVSDALLAALADTDPAAECWNFWPTAAKDGAFWFRRMALEVAVHRWDAESAGSETPAGFGADVAVDIIDEFVHVMLARALEKRGDDATASLDGDVHFHCTDADGEWTFEMRDGELAVADEHRKSAVAARGPAEALALLCYNRGDREGVEIFGDDDLLARWLG